MGGGELRVLQVFETERLALRELKESDANFILQLVNEPSWLRYIGDKGIRTVAAAEAYIRTGPASLYARRGYGLWLVELKEGAVPIGICGLIKRDVLEDVDIGFALLPAYWRKGYAFESAAATVKYGKEVVGLTRLVAIMSPDNFASHCLLEKLGFRFERMVRPSTNAPEVKMYGRAI
jgi:RimJ/RimL family protein N-acetyltransferase